jgi:hypothetical protein
MAYHGVLIPNSIAATNIDSLNRSVVDVADIDNGNVFIMGTKSTTAGLSEVWEISVPTSGAGLQNLWMAYSGDEIVVTDARYKGIDPDVRNFYNAAGKVFSAYKPQVGDIITLTDDAILDAYGGVLDTHINANASWELQWGTSQTASVLSYKLLAVKYISLATGAIDDQREAAYVFECIAIV